MNDDEKDAKRWRKLCGLMSYGDFIIKDSRSTEDPPLDINYIFELEATVDAGSELNAKAGHADDARCVIGSVHPKSGESK